MTNLSAEALRELPIVTVEQIGRFRDSAIAVAKERDAMLAERERLREALTDATESLNTLATLAGKDEYMKDMVEVRSYARSRHQVAMVALAAAGEE